MKKIIFVLPLIMLSICPALADSGNMKIKTVKDMYNAAIKIDRSSGDISDALFKFSDKNLQNAVALSQLNSTDEDGGLSDCFSAFETLDLGASNGYSLYEAKAIDYKLLKNGRVRANIKYTGKENINSSKFISYKDFSLKCSGSSCKITDVYDFSGVSGKSKAEKSCR